ncbi:MAG: hypothetical protein K6D94_07740, partial [Clostridiales bacterium]|nr:hypothetical protein [Clostridiales bacterium]
FDFIAENPDPSKPADSVSHLPSPELIQKQIPNPGGFGTGMEDCALNAGTMMDTVISRYMATGDESMREYAAAIYKGMELLTDVCGTPGFVARGVSPADMKSHYYNSSRDQFTHWVWGAYIYYFSGLPGKAEKESLREHIARLCSMCEKRCVEENDWDMLRDDGGPALVSKMWGDVDTHEIGRLPMFYAAAWKMTGDTHWLDLYRGMRERAYEGTLPFTPDGHPVYATQQLQYSLCLLYDAEDEPEWKERYLAIIRRIAALFEAKVVPMTEVLMRPERLADLSLKMERWDKVPAAWRGYLGGYPYYCPWRPEPVYKAFYPLLDIGECAATAALCPGYIISEDAAGCIDRLERAVDYDSHSTYAPMAVLNAGWRIKASKAVS